MFNLLIILLLVFPVNQFLFFLFHLVLIGRKYIVRVKVYYHDSLRLQDGLTHTCIVSIEVV